MTKTRLVMLGVAVGAVAMAGCGVDGQGSETDGVTLTWASTGGQYSEDEAAGLAEPYLTDSGNKLVQVAPAEFAKIRGMVDAGNVEWDLTSTTWFFGEQFCEEYFEPVDYSDVDESVIPEGMKGKCFMPSSLRGDIFSYDADEFDDPPQKIEDFFDVENYPGKRLVYGARPAGILEAALVADGVPAEEVYPIDVDRALAKLDTIKSDIIFAPSYGDLQQKMTDGEGTMMIAVQARTITTAQGGVNLEPVWDYTSIAPTAQQVPMNAPNADEAKALIASSLSLESQKKFAELSGVMPARTDIAFEDLDYEPVVAKFSPMGPDRGTLIYADVDWFVSGYDEALKAWTSWMLS